MSDAPYSPIPKTMPRLSTLWAFILFNALTGKKEDPKLVCLFKQNKRKKKDVEMCYCVPVGYIKKPVNTGPDKCLNGQVFTYATGFNRTVQILLEDSVLFAGSRVNERRFRESFFPFKNLSGPP